MIRLARSVDEERRDETLRVMQDKLLDAYGEWRRTDERRHLDESGAWPARSGS